jgi:hypothetical protein
MPTADQVAVSVSADFREYDRQTKQSAEAFEAAVNGMARDAENAAASVEASQKRIGAAALGVADKETQAAAKAEAAEQRKERPLFRRSARLKPPRTLPSARLPRGMRRRWRLRTRPVLRPALSDPRGRAFHTGCGGRLLPIILPSAIADV